MSKLYLAALLPLIFGGIAFAQTAPEWHHRPDPAEMHRDHCANHLAMAAARLAYVETKLELTEQQKPLFNKWRQIRLDHAAKEKSSCLSQKPQSDGQSILDRETRQEAMLIARLQTMQDSHAALQALYTTLTPDQRKILDHPRHGGWRHRHWKKWGGAQPDAAPSQP